MACPRPGLTWPPVKCDAGYYCPAGSSLSNETIHACPAGTYTDYHNLTHARECTDCPARQSCEAGTGGIQKPPQECATGNAYVLTVLGEDFVNRNILEIIAILKHNLSGLDNCFGTKLS